MKVIERKGEVLRGRKNQTRVKSVSRQKCDSDCSFAFDFCCKRECVGGKEGLGYLGT